MLLRRSPEADFARRAAGGIPQAAIVWILTATFLRALAHEAQRDLALRERGRVAKELKGLRGLIPICASCKKIRDAAGAWEPLASYISQRSEAHFSHGICEECAHDRYGVEL